MCPLSSKSVCVQENVSVVNHMCPCSFSLPFYQLCMFLWIYKRNIFYTSSFPQFLPKSWISSSMFTSSKHPTTPGPQGARTYRQYCPCSRAKADVWNQSTNIFSSKKTLNEEQGGVKLLLKRQIPRQFMIPLSSLRNFYKKVFSHRMYNLVCKSGL